MLTHFSFWIHLVQFKRKTMKVIQIRSITCIKKDIFKVQAEVDNAKN